MSMIAGIDYGSRRAGTTAVCLGNTAGRAVSLFQSVKNNCADGFILEIILSNSVSSVYIDAPLSLPGVYCSMADFKDYFYRRADKSLTAMSPMFLGGLTARAMKLKSKLEESGIEVFEVYPGGLARKLNLDEFGYKGVKEDIPACYKALQNHFSFESGILPANWHQFDAILAFFSGFRQYQGNAEQYGEDREGLIFI